jgi:curved DNA-binding protein CbpA
MADDLYRLLGVSSDAPERAIKRSYHDLARKMHPDKAKNPDEAKRLEEEFAAITRAYNTLKSPELRKDYDAKRERDDAKPSAPATPPATLATKSKPKPKAEGDSEGGGKSTRSAAPLDKAVEAGRLGIAERSYGRGMQLSNMGDDVRAVEFFETAIRNNRDDARYHARLAQSLMRSRRGFTRSIEAANRACLLDQYNVEYKMILARIYERAGSISLATKEYENILKWDAGNLEATACLKALRSPQSDSTFVNLWHNLKTKLGMK